MLRIVVVLAIFALASSCGSIKRAETAKQAQASMVGMSKEQVLACMGAPSQRAAEGETEVWGYASGDGELTVALTGTANGNFGSAIGVSSERFCKIDVVMRAGLVSTVNYSGPTGGLLTKGSQCGYAVEHCVRP